MSTGDNGNLAGAQGDANTSFPDKAVGSASSSCGSSSPDKKLVPIAFHLLRLPWQDPPKWWPAENKDPYSSEKYKAQLTDGPRSGSLDGGGGAQFDQIPPGSCDFQVDTQFYKKVEDYLNKLGR